MCSRRARMSTAVNQGGVTWRGAPCSIHAAKWRCGGAYDCAPRGAVLAHAAAAVLGADGRPGWPGAAPLAAVRSTKNRKEDRIGQVVTEPRSFTRPSGQQVVNDPWQKSSRWGTPVRTHLARFRACTPQPAIPRLPRASVMAGCACGSATTRPEERDRARTPPAWMEHGVAEKLQGEVDSLISRLTSSSPFCAFRGGTRREMRRRFIAARWPRDAPARGRR